MPDAVLTDHQLAQIRKVPDLKASIDAGTVTMAHLRDDPHAVLAAAGIEIPPENRAVLEAGIRDIVERHGDVDLAAAVASADASSTQAVAIGAGCAACEVALLVVLVVLLVLTVIAVAVALSEVLPILAPAIEAFLASNTAWTVTAGVIEAVATVIAVKVCQDLVHCT